MKAVYDLKFVDLAHVIHCVKSDGARRAVTKANAKRYIARGWRVCAFRLWGTTGWLELRRPGTVR